MVNLKYRHELKYYINFHDYTILQHRLKNIMKLDQNADTNGEYLIRSLYFDDINNTALSDKLAGVSERSKYRIRTYNGEDKQIFLEKKIKNDSYIAKQKEIISMDTYKSIINGDFSNFKESDKPLQLEVAMKMKNILLKPKVIVEYMREAYIASTGNVRITFDKLLKTGLNEVDIFKPDLAMIRALDDNFIILEVKYDEYLPEYIRVMLQLEGLTRQSVSKYTICRKYIKSNMWEDN